MKLPTDPNSIYLTDKGREFRLIGLTKMEDAFIPKKWRAEVKYLDTNTIGYFDFDNEIKVFQLEMIKRETLPKLLDWIFPNRVTLIKNERGFFEKDGIKIFVKNWKGRTITKTQIAESFDKVVIAKFVNGKKIWQYETY